MKAITLKEALVHDFYSYQYIIRWQFTDNIEEYIATTQ